MNSKKNIVKEHEHYYTPKPKTKIILTPYEDNLRGNKIKIISGSSVFSIGETDRGTRLLIEHSIIKDNWNILDLGCGCGVLGLSIAKAFPNCRILMTDVNERAVYYAKKGIKENNLKNIEAVSSNIFNNINDKFDTILLNPPQTAGKKICFQMIEESKNYLKEKGILQIVARHKKGGKTLSEHMNEVFGNVEDIKKSGGFRIYVSYNLLQ
jgi:16S rRNA (guanine1207-N2)-methyltransferase